jgi:tRNA(Ile2) C34 agmatinyltransferase TiaS
MYTYTINVVRSNDDTDPGLSGVIAGLRNMNADYTFEHIEYRDDIEVVEIKTNVSIELLLDTCNAVSSYDYTEE